MGNITVVGSLNMDYDVTVQDFPKPGETILGKELYICPGGKGANQAYAIGKLGGNVQMIGCVGNDANGREQLRNLASVNVNVESIQVLDHANTGYALITINEKGENNIVVVSGANYELTPTRLASLENVLESSSIIVTQLETPLDTVEYLADYCRKHNKIFVLDPAPAVSNLSDNIIKNVDIIKPNETELAVLTGLPTNTIDEIEYAARALLEKGAKNVLVTMGNKGTAWISSGVFKTFSAQKVKAVDTTAAGDCFLAAFVCVLEKEWNVPKAIEYASIASSISVTRKGAQESIPTELEVAAVINNKTATKL